MHRLDNDTLEKMYPTHSKAAKVQEEKGALREPGWHGNAVGTAISEEDRQKLIDDWDKSQQWFNEHGR